MSIKREDLYAIFKMGFEGGVCEELYRNTEHEIAEKNRGHYTKQLEKRFSEIMFMIGYKILDQQEKKTNEE